MHLLISGSSGLIGTALVERLHRDGHRTTALVRPTSTGAGIAWDPGRAVIDEDALADAGPFDAVVHLAGAGIGDKRWSPTRKQEILASRTDSTSLLASALSRLPTPPQVIVSASAVGFYGDTGANAVTEDAERGTGFLADVCVHWEDAAAPLADTGARLVLLRTGIVLTPRGGALAKQLPLFRLGVGGRTGSGHQYRSWITLDDEVDAILHCIATETLSGPVNATAPTPATDQELAHALGRALHRPAALPVPAAALRIVLGTEMADQLLLTGQRVLPDRLVHSGFTFTHEDLDSALEAILAR